MKFFTFLLFLGLLILSNGNLFTRSGLFGVSKVSGFTSQEVKKEEKKGTEKKTKQELKKEDKKGTEKKTEEKKKAQSTEEVKGNDKKKDGEGSEVEEKPFSQEDADKETLIQGGLKDDGETILNYFRFRKLTPENQIKLSQSIRDFSSEDFDVREKASQEIKKIGYSAIETLKKYETDRDPEIAWRCQSILESIEKIPTSILSTAAIRRLEKLRPAKTVNVLLDVLPDIDDSYTLGEIANCLSQFVVENNKENQELLQSLQNKSSKIRAVVLEALIRGGNASILDKVSSHYREEKDPEIKMNIAVGMVNDAQNKSYLKDLIVAINDLPQDKSWPAEEILFYLAGENPPKIDYSGAESDRKVVAQEWKKWLDNETNKIDLKVLKNREKLHGYTMIICRDQRGINGNITEIGLDGKKRWSLDNLQFPMDAQYLPGDRILVAEQGMNKVSIRNLKGKELWSVAMNQPVNVSAFHNGNILAVGRNEIVEYDTKKKEVFKFTRNSYDIVSAKKSRNGDYFFLTQGGQCIRIDKKGKELKSFAIGRINYWADMQLLANGNILITQLNGIGEFTAEGKSVSHTPYSYPSSVQRLPNGRMLVCSMNGANRGTVQEIDRKGKSMWQYKSPNANNAFIMVIRAKRR